MKVGRKYDLCGTNELILGLFKKNPECYSCVMIEKQQEIIELNANPECYSCVIIEKQQEIIELSATGRDMFDIYVINNRLFNIMSIYAVEAVHY